MATTQAEVKLAQLQIPNRKCETCHEIMAMEWRGEPGKVEEVLYFCINSEKNCPLYHVTQ